MGDEIPEALFETSLTPLWKKILAFHVHLISLVICSS